MNHSKQKNPIGQSLIIFLLVVWYFIILLNILGVISFGKNSISVDWFVYSVCWLLLVLVVRHFCKDKKLFIIPLFLILFQTVVFNLAILYNWYQFSPLVNRAEHFLGTIIALVIIDILLSSQQNFKEISKIYQILTMAGLALILTTLNEIIELGLDYFTAADHIGPDVWDTNLDLLANSLAILVYVSIRFTRP